MHESLKQVQGKMSPLLLLHQIHPRVSSQNSNLNFLGDETLTLDFKMFQRLRNTGNSKTDKWGSENEDIGERR